jgi:hypothetical protein
LNLTVSVGGALLCRRDLPRRRHANHNCHTAGRVQMSCCPLRGPVRLVGSASPGSSSSDSVVPLAAGVSGVALVTLRDMRASVRGHRGISVPLRRCSIRASRSFGSFDGWDAGHCRRRTSARHAGWGLGEGPGRDCFGRAARRARRGQTGGSCLG